MYCMNVSLFAQNVVYFMLFVVCLSNFSWHFCNISCSVSDPYSFFSGSGSGSRVWGWIPIRIRIQSGSRALMTKNWKKITAEKKFKFFLIKNCNSPIPGLLKYVQVTEEALSSQKRPPNTSKHELLQTFFYFCGSFCPPGSGSGFRIRIRIH